MHILYGTGNPAKLEAMKKRLSHLNIELIGLNELSCDIPNVIEDGKTPLENAGKKAITYYKAFHIPVFSCDSGLYFDGIPENEQPGVDVRTVAGKRLSDREMTAYYAGLAKKHGNLTARYKNAISLVIDEEHIYNAMVPSMESEPFILTGKAHILRKKGFPLDCLSIDIKTGKYYYDLSERELDRLAVEDGFLDFFRRITVMFPQLTATEESAAY